MRNFWLTVVDNVLITLLLFTPLALGAVHFWSIAVFCVISVIIFDIHFLRNSPALKEALKFPIVKWGIFFVAIILFQITPLPKCILKFISPHTYNVYSNYSLTYTSGDSWRSISIYPWATVSELIKIISYGFIFLIVIAKAGGASARTAMRPAANEHTRKLNPNLLTYLQLGCLTGMLTILFHSFVDFNLHITANAFYFVVILALCIGLEKLRDSASEYTFVLKIINSIIVIGFFIAVFGIVYKFGGARSKIYWIIDKDSSGFGPYINLDHYAGYMGMCSSLAIAYFMGCIRVSSFFSLKGIKKRILWFSTPEANLTMLYLFFSLIMSGSLFLSASRGGILSFSMAMLLFFFLIIIKTKRQRSKRVFFSAVLILLLIAIVVIWVGPEEWLGRFSEYNIVIRHIIHEVPLSQDYRLLMWNDTANLIKDFPLFGTGLGTFSSVFPGYRTFEYKMRFLRYAHSDYLQLISEMGIFGVLFILAFIIFFVRKYMVVVRHLR